MKSFLAKLMIKYRVVVFEKESLEKLKTFYINPFYVFLGLSVVFSFCFLLSCVILTLSPLGNKFFDYSKKNEIADLYLHVDSISHLLNLQLDYTENLKLILNSKEDLIVGEAPSVLFSLQSLHKKITEQDSSLVNFIKKMDEESVISYNKRIFEKLQTSVPTSGIITSSFNINDGHFGVDIAAQENSEVLSVLSGTVVFSGHSNDFGNFIVMSHEHNFLSVYLHNSTLLKKTGDLVLVGEKIALVGSSGKLSSAPHLHFELWYGTIPVDPEKYLDF